MTPTMQATQGAETTPLSDEAILGIEPETSASAAQAESPDAIEAEFASSGANDARDDDGGAASGEAAVRGAARALRPREIDYARTSDDDIFAM